MIRGLVLAMLVLLAACGADLPISTPTQAPSAEPVPTDAAPNPTTGPIEAAPGSDSEIYPPNPGAIVVAIDAGHGGCLDWGVPDPSERGVQLAEKTLTLGIAQALRDLLEADGVRVVMIRDSDEALAGDDYPPLDCEGPPFRDVNGDGMSGFGNDDQPEATRTRDELQARLDLANLSRADALVSIHINSPFDAGQPVEIAFSETFYTDETPWGVDATARLADAIESGVVAHLGAIADYDRGDRGTTAHNFYLVAPPLLEETEERPNRWAQPTRGGLMPVVLSEVGSITLRAEHDLLASDTGQDAVATGLFEGIAAFFEDRPLAARIGLAGGADAVPPSEVPGDGPPYWAEVVPDGPVRLTLTNTGTRAWASDLDLVAGWQETDQPYLAFPPDALEPIGVTVPALAPGESVTIEVTLPPAPDGRSVAWISLREGSELFSDLGSPALQLSSEAP
ncbi:MAG TPA: N-acetylmuramoyl-L-alanine amidase [Candidatus Limnocylindria bacterium]|nr:N-acetylmuramoyl-L-alanine amidase [Candidatus Limnocylindria bacterium]